MISILVILVIVSAFGLTANEFGLTNNQSLGVAACAWSIVFGIKMSFEEALREHNKRD